MMKRGARGIRGRGGIATRGRGRGVVASSRGRGRGVVGTQGRGSGRGVVSAAPTGRGRGVVATPGRGRGVVPSARGGVRGRGRGIVGRGGMAAAAGMSMSPSPEEKELDEEEEEDLFKAPYDVNKRWTIPSFAVMFPLLKSCLLDTIDPRRNFKPKYSFQKEFMAWVLSIIVHHCHDRLNVGINPTPFPSYKVSQLLLQCIQYHKRYGFLLFFQISLFIDCLMFCP